jgi:hypothetical protein
MRSRASSLTAFTARKGFGFFFLAIPGVYRKLSATLRHPNL